MKKKVMATVLAMCLALSLAACGEETAADSAAQPIAQSGETSETAPAQSAAAGENTAAAETVPAGSEALDEPMSGDELMASFAAGELTAIVKDTYLNKIDYNDGNFTAGEAMDVAAIQQHLGVGMMGVNWVSVSYGKVEVSQAAGDWYVLDMGFDAGESMGTGRDQFLIQIEEGSLEIVMGIEEFYRGFGGYNKYGIANDGGSGGAGLFSENYYTVDANGDAQCVYESEVSSGGWDLWEGENPNEAVNTALGNAYTKTNDAGLDVADVCIEQRHIGDQYYYILRSENEKVTEIMKACCEEGKVTLTSAEDADALVASRCSTLGITTEQLFSGDAYTATQVQ